MELQNEEIWRNELRESVVATRAESRRLCALAKRYCDQVARESQWTAAERHDAFEIRAAQRPEITRVSVSSAVSASGHRVS